MSFGFSGLVSRNALDVSLFSARCAEDGFGVGDRDVYARISAPGVHETAGIAVSGRYRCHMDEQNGAEGEIGCFPWLVQEKKV